MDRNRIRLSILLVFLLVTSGLLASFVAAQSGNRVQSTAIHDGTDGALTAISVQASTGTEEGIIVVDGDGDLVYRSHIHDNIADIDPAEAGRFTLLYVGTDYLSAGDCVGTVPCRRNVVGRLNISTNERETLFTHVEPFRPTPNRVGLTGAIEHSVRWHDVDRIGPDRFLVGDIADDSVYVYNSTTGLKEWAWEVQEDIPIRESGSFPYDFSHVNDVELLADGRIMASLRNQDQVVFLEREGGLARNWTLGTDDDYSILFEQHNPDYIPAERGGPAIVVADSHNNRIAEYEREDREWLRTWTWSDEELRWPRDADRLPSGNTLITDTTGQRVLEVDGAGDVVWEVNVTVPYEAERLGTGDESAGGESATRLGLESRVYTGDRDPELLEDPIAWATNTGERIVPNKLLVAVDFMLPWWVGATEFIAILVLVLLALAWLVLEARWSRFSIDLDFDIPRRQ